jgi:hypothetical protein
MLKKFSIFIILLLFTVNCGFTPIYSKKDVDFSLEKLNFLGDRTINNYIKSNLQKYKNNNSKRKITLNVETIYEKNLISKDLTGTINKYELVAQVTFIINPGEQKMKFTQKKIMERMNNKFDEKDFERTAKQTFANIIAGEFIQQLINF